MADYKLLYRAYGNLDASSIQLLLQSFQIPSQIIQESVGVTYGLNVGKLGSANVYVKEENYQAAREIIELMEAGKLELSTPNEDIDHPLTVDDNLDVLMDEDDLDDGTNSPGI